MDLASQQNLVRNATTAALVVAVGLLLVKIFAWSASESASVLSSLLDSLLDVAATAINFIAVRYAQAPADQQHPFGHGKAEGLAALFQAAFILGSVLMLLLHLLERLWHPQPLQGIEQGLGLMVFSTVVTLALVMFQRWVFKQTQSMVIKADSAHFASDIWINLAVMTALIFAHFNVLWLDPVIALVIALVLLHSVWEVGRLALAVLMDESMSQDEVEQIAAIIQQTPGVLGFHDLKTRQSGTQQFIQLHLELPAQQSLQGAHYCGDAVTTAIRSAFQQADVLIHHDPVEAE